MPDQCRKEYFQQTGLRQLGNLHAKTWSWLDPCPSYLNTRSPTIKLLGKNVGINICDYELDGFLDITPKQKQQNRWLGLQNLKLVHQRTHSRNGKDSPE